MSQLKRISDLTNATMFRVNGLEKQIEILTKHYNIKQTTTCIEDFFDELRFEIQYAYKQQKANILGIGIDLVKIRHRPNQPVKKFLKNQGIK